MGRDGRGRREDRGGDHEAGRLQHGLGQGLRSGHLSGKDRGKHTLCNRFLLLRVYFFSSCVFRARVWNVNPIHVKWSGYAFLIGC